MLKKRVIPVLLLQGGGLVKTIKFDNPKYIGDPINAIRIFNQKEVDELIILDISSSIQFKEPNYDLIKAVAGECFMPLTYGGGIRTIDQAKRIFDLGVEKISIQSAAFDNIDFISALVKLFGSSSVVLSVDMKKTFFGGYKVFNFTKKIRTPDNWKDWLKQLVNSGCGEIFLNSVDKDGTLDGPDINLVHEVSQIVNIPLIVAGGISSLHDMKKLFNVGANAVAAGAFFVYYGPHRGVLITYPKYHEIEKILL